jgi:hypothetical protein
MFHPFKTSKTKTNIKKYTVMHEAEKYLLENNSGRVYVRYCGEKRRLFITGGGVICMVSQGRRNVGYPFSDWEGISKVLYPVPTTDLQKNLVEKYRREASKASFTNHFIRLCREADAGKTLYENGITTENAIDGKIISLASVAKAAPYEAERFQTAMKNRTVYHSSRFPFRGYEGTLEVSVNEQGEPMGHLAVEYKNCGNGYYYLFINDQNFIGYDVD